VGAVPTKAAIPAALFPQHWRGVPKNCFVHSYPLTGRTGAMGSCQGGRDAVLPPDRLNSPGWDKCEFISRDALKQGSKARCVFQRELLQLKQIFTITVKTMKLFQFLKKRPVNSDSDHEKKSNHRQSNRKLLAEEGFLIPGETFRSGLRRAFRVFYECMRGFYAFKNVRNCITVFGSARFDEHHHYYRMARVMGRALAKDGFTVMTGGGPGIMEAANRGAREAEGVAKGASVSCNIELNDVFSEFPNKYVDRMIIMHYFFVRKVMLTKYSLAFIVMPGGLGTLDELFEVVTLIQTGKLRNFPVILMGKDFWQPLIDFMEKILLKNATISPEDLERLLITDSPEEALTHIHKYINHNHHYKSPRL
jgi:uncharacterized protein (TIGR00730 family)